MSDSTSSASTSHDLETPDDEMETTCPDDYYTEKSGTRFTRSTCTEWHYDTD